MEKKLERVMDIAAEPATMTYGMSEELRNSDLLQRISRLSLNDKQCLIRYISEEVEVEAMEDDEWDSQDTSNLTPYTLDELYARIEESERQYQSGEYYTATESNKLLKEKFLWLQ